MQKTYRQRPQAANCITLYSSFSLFFSFQSARLLAEGVAQNKEHSIARAHIDWLFALLLSEYQRGYADNDHALMQNTGIFDSTPIHIDVGQFVKNPVAADPKVYRQELFSKMWKFRIWLRKNYSEWADYTDERLEEIIGPSYATLKPQLNKSSMGRIPAYN